MEHAIKAVKAITSLHLPAEDGLIEPDDIEASPTVKNDLEIHIIKLFFNEQNVLYLQFFKIATEKKPFFTQFYGKGAWGHQKIAAADNYCGSCLGNYEPNEEWLQRPVYKICFHLNYFVELYLRDITVCLSNFFVNFLDFYVEQKKIIKLGNFQV